MNRVVITGIGIISCLGRGQNEVLDALINARSGLELNQEYKDNGMRCHVSGKMKFSIDEIDRKMGRFMSETSAYSFVAAEEAIKDSGLDNDDIANNETGVIVGSGTGSSREIKRVFEASENGIKKIGPYSVTRTMGNTTSAVISTFFQTKGISLSISSACSTSLHCVSHGFNLIKNGGQKIVIAGGSEDDHWTGAMMFDAMGALSTKYNETPTKASRPYDIDRDGLMKGLNSDATKRLSDSVSIPVIGSGGINGPENLENVKQNIPNLEGVIAGKAIYTGALRIEDALRILKD